MASQINFMIVMLMSLLVVFGLARGTVGSMHKAEDERSLLKLLTEHEPPTLAKYQLFPRDDVHVVTVTETVCGHEPGASQTSSASDSVPGVSTSSSGIISSDTAIPSSTFVSSTTIAPSSTTLWTSTLASSLSSTIPVAPITSSSEVTPSSTFSSSLSSSAPSGFTTSISSSATQSASESASSKTTENTATATAPDSASTTEPSQSDAAFRPTGARTAMVVLLTMLSVLFV